MVKKNEENVIFNELPDCYGRKKNGHHCVNCKFDNSCKYYEASTKSIETEDRHWNTGLMFTHIGEREFSSDYIKNKIKSKSITFINKDGKYVDSEQINIDLITWALLYGAEYKKLAQALAYSLHPDVKNCSDIADILGISRQGLNKSLREMLNLDKKKVPDSKIKKLTGNELDIMNFYNNNKNMSIRQIASSLKKSKSYIFNVIKKLKKEEYIK